MKFLRNDASLKQLRRELRRNQTEAEKIFWTHMRNKQFYGMKFFRQYSIGPHILDFYCPAMRLAIELDGGQHAEEETREYDKLRTDYLKTKGIDVIRFWNNDVIQNIEGILMEIEKRIISPLL